MGPKTARFVKFSCRLVAKPSILLDRRKIVGIRRRVDLLDRGSRVGRPLNRVAFARAIGAYRSDDVPYVENRPYLVKCISPVNRPAKKNVAQAVSLADQREFAATTRFFPAIRADNYPVIGGYFRNPFVVAQAAEIEVNQVAEFDRTAREGGETSSRR